MHASLEEWGQWMHAIGSSEATVRTRTNGVRTLQRHAGLLDPRDVNGPHIIAWLAHCHNASTRHTYWMSVHMWFSYLQATGQRDDDPTARVPKPKQPKGVPRPVSERVVRKVLSNPPGHRSYAYIVLASFAGLRVHEVAKIRGEDIDWGTGWMFVCGKGGQEAMIPMHPRVRELARGMPDVGYWFPGSHDGHVAADTVSRVIRNAFVAVGSTATAHMCRHLAGTALLRECHDVRLVQRFLRHQSLNSTQIYTRVSDDALADAVNSLGWAS